MFELMMVLTLSSLNVTQTAGIQPCLWPKCEKPAVEIAFIQPCIWPKCAKTENVFAQIETCQWPKKCDLGSTTF